MKVTFSLSQKKSCFGKKHAQIKWKCAPIIYIVENSLNSTLHLHEMAGFQLLFFKNKTKKAHGSEQQTWYWVIKQ